MKKPMKTLQKNALIALAVLGMSSAAVTVQAQTAAPEGRRGHAGQEQRQANGAEEFAKHQAKLHDALQLSAAQEPAWATYQAAIKPNEMQKHGPRPDWAGLSAPVRMEKMVARAKQHLVALESRVAALNSFYAVLTPPQKKVFDENIQSGERDHGPRMKGAMKH
ncbi:MAG: hypothetical protein JWP34_225 [Massilia sp.]|nr:hypothetical protein [Massilia sp.]